MSSDNDSEVIFFAEGMDIEFDMPYDTLGRQQEVLPGLHHTRPD